VEINSPQIWATCVFLINLPKVNPRQRGEKSSNLVTLILGGVVPFSIKYLRMYVPGLQGGKVCNQKSNLVMF
jgi:hypothetical protein